MDYDLDIDKAVKKIITSKAKFVCIQLPDGLKRFADKIQKEIEQKTNAKVVIWLGSCFGSCDVPDLKNIDLLVQWGHSKWK